MKAPAHRQLLFYCTACAAVIILWLTSHFWPINVRWIYASNRALTLNSHRGRVTVGQVMRFDPPDRLVDVTFERGYVRDFTVRSDGAEGSSMTRYYGPARSVLTPQLGFFYADSIYGPSRGQSGLRLTRLQIPYWVILLLPVLAAARCMWRNLEQQRQQEQGLCPRCGYDLRAHGAGQACPECGRTVTQRRTSPGPTPSPDLDGP